MAENFKRKKLNCPYCQRRFANFVQHLEYSHENEKEVRQMSGKNKVKRAAIIKELRMLGYRMHNEKVRLTGEGEYIPRHQKRNASVNGRRYIQCPDCFNLITKRYLKNHICDKKKSEEQKATIRSRAISAWSQYKAENVSPSTRKLLDTIMDSEERDVLCKDALLLYYADLELSKLELEPKVVSDSGSIDQEPDAESDDMPCTYNLKNDIRAKLRSLARFVIFYQKRTKTKDSLLDIFRNFTFRNLKGTIEDYSDQYKKSESAKKLETRLKELLKVAIMYDKSTNFLTKQVELKTVVAIVNAHVRRANKAKNLKKSDGMPSKNEIKIFLNYTNKNLRKFVNIFDTNYIEYLQFCRLIIAKLTFHSLRRSGEVCKMTVKQFERRQKGNGTDMGNITVTLTEEEVSTGQQIEVVKLQGKSTSRQVVLAILQPEDVAYIKKLLATRASFEDLKDNKYVFACRGHERPYVDGCKAIKKIGQGCSIKLTAGIYRKLISTEAVFVQNNLERRLLSSQLGHDMTVHKKAYEHHMQKGVAKFCKIPTMLNRIERAVKKDNTAPEKQPPAVDQEWVRNNDDGDNEDTIGELRNRNTFPLCSDESDGENNADDSFLNNATSTTRDNSDVSSAESDERNPDNDVGNFSNSRIRTRKNVSIFDCEESNSQNKYNLENDQSISKISMRKKRIGDSETSGDESDNTGKRRKLSGNPSQMRWSRRMEKVLEEVFHKELIDKSLKIPTAKIRDAVEKIKKLRVNISYSKVKATIYSIKRNQRPLFSKRS